MQASSLRTLGRIGALTGTVGVTAAVIGLGTRRAASVSDIDPSSPNAQRRGDSVVFQGLLLGSLGLAAGAWSTSETARVFGSRLGVTTGAAAALAGVATFARND